MNEKKHWDHIAPSYNDEIFDVYASDRNKILPRYIAKHKGKNKTAIDFGCGNGKSFPYLAPNFKLIVGLDISKGLLKQAKQLGYNNIELKQADLTRRNLGLPKSDFIFCCNVIMFPDLNKNHQAIENIYHLLKPGGSALIVLPSLDSAFFSSWRLIDVYKKEGVTSEQIPPSEFNYFKASKRELVQGIIHIDGVPTKHYSQSEILVTFRDHGFEITTVEKLEYNWETEINPAPVWLKDPYPWDWLVELRKPD